MPTTEQLPGLPARSINRTLSAGTLPIYRTWNQQDTNHRYTMDARVQSMMMGRSHMAEGYGNPPVAMCSPQ